MADVQKYPDYNSCYDVNNEDSNNDNETSSAKTQSKWIVFRSFDQVLKKIGAFNMFHVRFIIIFQIAIITLAGNLTFATYSTVEPEVKCLTADRNIIEMNHSHSDSFCQVYKAGECIELHWNTPFQTIIEEWNLICDLDHVPQMINSIQASGEFVALTLAGPLSDMFGRKRVLSFMFLSLLLATIGSALSTDWKYFVMFRFIVGGLAEAAITVYTVWAMELTDERHNVIMNLAASYQFGYMITALIAYLCYQWRTFLFILVLIGVIPLFFIVVLFVESPRWQVQKGKLDKASKGLTVISSSQISAKQLSKIACETHSEAKLLCFSLFSTKHLALYTIVLCVGVFATESAVSGYRFQVTQFSGSPFINIALYGGFRIIIPITLYFCDQYVEWFGRRHMFLIPMGLVSLLYFLLSIRDTYFPGWVQSLTFYYMLSAAVIANFNWIAIGQYTVELYPTIMRNTAYSCTDLFHTLACVLVPQLVYLEKYWPSILIYAIVLSALVSFISGFIVYPETKGKDLPETTDSVPEPWISDYNIKY